MNMAENSQEPVQEIHFQVIRTIDGQEFKDLVQASLTWLRTNQQMINSLNVFPVPDGDTGTNMLLTMQSAYNEIAESTETRIGPIAHDLAQGALLGARGNSGVILSQIWRGFARAMDNLETMDADLFVKGLIEAKNTAYKGVVRPVEGTILTVAKDIATAAEEAAFESNDLMKVLESVVDAANESVRRTPDLLPILKQAGVVDSGGKGLYIILEGMLRSSKGYSLETPLVMVQPLEGMNLQNVKDSVEEGQDYEVVVDFKPEGNLDLHNFYEGLTDIGTSIQVGEGDGMYRMHIHVETDRRYEPIDYTMKYGTITKVAMENLVEQTGGSGGTSGNNFELMEVQPGQIAVVAISPGDGISRIFASLGAAAIVQGGQTMNPSTEEILRAFENLPTEKIIILPNNKNIILAAQSAASMTVKSVKVIRSKNVPQGLSAILRLDPDGDLDLIEKQMEESLTDIETGEITTAIRTVQINEVDVKEGEVIVLHNGQLINSAANLEDACFEFLKSAGTMDRERITIFYGSNIERPKVNEIADLIRSKYPKQELEIHEGGQPYYQFILSVE
jgi:DAK2 domain fusion protein YloV